MTCPRALLFLLCLVCSACFPGPDSLSAATGQLLLSLHGDTTRLYDLESSQVVGRLYGLHWSKATWSPDGSLALLFQPDSNRIHQIDITSFSLVRSIEPSLFLDPYSSPVIETGKRWAFIYGSEVRGGKRELLRISLADGSISVVDGLAEDIELTDEPLYLPEENKLLIGATGLVFKFDPANGAFTTVATLPAFVAHAFQADLARQRVFIFNGKVVSFLKGEPYHLELAKDYSTPVDAPWGETRLGLQFEDILHVPSKGVLVFRNLFWNTQSDLGELVYLDTRDRLDPLHNIDPSQVFPFSAATGTGPFFPGISVSSDGTRLWIAWHQVLPDEPDSPGLIPFDFDTHRFLTPIRLTGLEEDAYPGTISAWSPPTSFGAPMYGDQDDNGRIDTFDLLGLLRGLARPGTIQGSERLDLDHSGSLDIHDLILMLRLLSGQ